MRRTKKYRTAAVVRLFLRETNPVSRMRRDMGSIAGRGGLAKRRRQHVTLRSNSFWHNGHFRTLAFFNNTRIRRCF